MDAEVDPAADALWDSVGTVVALSGREDRRPRTDEEWRAVRRSAITLVEATNLLVMPGRRIAPLGVVATSGDIDPLLLQHRLEGNPRAFAALVQSLRRVAINALDAIDARDADRLFEIGAQLDTACEACHVVFWYPHDLTPAK